MKVLILICCCKLFQESGALKLKAVFPSSDWAFRNIKHEHVSGAGLKKPISNNGEATQTGLYK